MRMPKRKRKPVASDGSEKLVLDQCALFALQRAVSAVQDREVSSQEILGALRGAAKWALAHRHDELSRDRYCDVYTGRIWEFHICTSVANVTYV